MAVADHGGGISNKKGLNIPKLIAYVKKNKSRSVKGFPQAQPFEGSEVITWDVDVLIPAALESVITKRNAKDVRARIIVEGANSPSDTRGQRDSAQERRVGPPGYSGQRRRSDRELFRMGAEYPAVSLGIGSRDGGALKNNAEGLCRGS